MSRDVFFAVIATSSQCAWLLIYTHTNIYVIFKYIDRPFTHCYHAEKLLTL